MLKHLQEADKTKRVLQNSCEVVLLSQGSHCQPHITWSTCRSSTLKHGTKLPQLAKWIDFFQHPGAFLFVSQTGSMTNNHQEHCTAHIAVSSCGPHLHEMHKSQLAPSMSLISRSAQDIIGRLHGQIGYIAGLLLTASQYGGCQPDFTEIQRSIG